MNKKIPVTVLTGFLGSGKTTLLNYILKSNHGKRIAVIENEFGEVGVDDQLVEKKVHEEENIIEMMNGCICCTVRGDLVKILKDLIDRSNKIDYILIETTGLADPAPVAQTFFVDEIIQESYFLDGIVTLIDAKHVEQHLDEIRAPEIENEAKEQIAFSDRIILNKIDLVSEKDLLRVKERIKSINRSALLIETQQAKVNLDQILGIGAFSLNNVLEMDPEFLKDQDHQHDKSISSVGISFEGSLNPLKLDKWINLLIQTRNQDLFRYKGVLNVYNEDRKFIFQGVHMLFMNMPFITWGKNEKRINKFCFIGRNLNREELTTGFEACIMQPKDLELRFKVGDKVKCNTGKWQKGTVIKIWDEGNCYRIKLTNGEEVWAPFDIDELIKKI